MLRQVDDAAKEIGERFESIKSPEDFESSSSNRTLMDAICMNLIAIGETLKKIDKKTKGDLLARYPEIPWTAAMKMRDIMAHHYFKVIPEIVFGVCQDDIPGLHKTLAKILKEING